MAEGPIPPLQFPQTTVECERCGADVDVTWFCKNCPASLCNACKKDHSKDKLLRKHEVVLRSGSVLWSHGSWKVKEPCKKHDNSDLVTYCNDCKVPCCIDCMLEHQRHAFTKLETKYIEAESRLNALVDDLSKSSIQTLQKEISTLKQKSESLNENFNLLNTELNTIEDKVIKAVEQSFEKIRQDFSVKRIECSSNIDEKIKSCEHEIKEVEIFIAKNEQKIRTGGLDLIEYFPSPPVITSSHFDVSITVPRFIFNDDIIKEIEGNVGQISYETKEGSRNIVSVQNSYTKGKKESQVSTRGNQEKVIIPDIETKMISSFTARLYGRSITPTSDGTAWVSCEREKTMYLYNEAGKELQSITVQESDGIFEITLKKSGDIILTCRDNKVRHVSADGKRITALIDTKPFSPRGVCLTDREEIVVCMRGKGDKNHVAVYTPDGKSKVREITVFGKDNKQLFTYPFRVVINAGQIIVLNGGENLVSVDQQSGKLFWVYDGCKGKKENDFFPSDICKDSFSNLLVTNYHNGDIHYIDRRGNLLKIILIHEYGLTLPIGISVGSQSGKIWCGSGASYEILLLKYI